MIPREILLLEAEEAGRELGMRIAGRFHPAALHDI